MDRQYMVNKNLINKFLANYKRYGNFVKTWNNYHKVSSMVELGEEFYNLQVDLSHEFLQGDFIVEVDSDGVVYICTKVRIYGTETSESGDIDDRVLKCLFRKLLSRGVYWHLDDHVKGRLISDFQIPSGYQERGFLYYYDMLDHSTFSTQFNKLKNKFMDLCDYDYKTHLIDSIYSKIKTRDNILPLIEFKRDFLAYIGTEDTSNKKISGRLMDVKGILDVDSRDIKNIVIASTDNTPLWKMLEILPPNIPGVKLVDSNTRVKRK